MKKALILALAAITCAGLAVSAANATTVFEQDFTCPIGGEKFEANVIGSYSSFGQRPDGRSYGTLPIYPIVECPGNGFLLIKDEFDESEIAILTQAVASAEYQTMRTTETQNYRAWWLRKAIGGDPYELAGTLLGASWETDYDLDRKARYQAAFIAAATSLVRDDEQALNWFWLRIRAANALRELGYFDKSIALLDQLDKPDLIPADPEQARGARLMIDGLRALAGEENHAVDPANLIPDRYAAVRCVIQRPALTASEESVCASTEVVGEIESWQTKGKDGKKLRGAEAIREIFADGRLPS